MQFEQDTSSLYLLDAGNHASKSYFSAAALYDGGASAVNKEKVFFFFFVLFLERNVASFTTRIN